MLKTRPILTPLSMGQLLDRAFRLYRTNFLTFAGIVGIVQLLVVPFNLFPLLGPEFLSLTFVGSLIGGFFGMIAAGALIRAISSSYLGHPLTIREAYQQIKPEVARIVTLWVISIGVSIVLVIWSVIPLFGWFTGPGILFFFGLCISPLFMSVVVLETQDMFGSLRRAWDLARRRFWWVMGYSFLLFILGQILITVPVLLMVFGSQIFFGEQSVWPTIMQTFFTLVLAVFYTPFQWTAYALLYFDLRIRTEGLDLAWEVNAQEAEPAESVNPIYGLSDFLATAPEPESTPLITRPEWLHMVLLSVAVLGVLVVYVAVAVTFVMLFFPPWAS